MIEQWIWQLKKLSYLHAMKVTFTDNGKQIACSCNSDIVTWMRENAFTKYHSNKNYMMDYAKRAVLLNNEDIRATNEDDFINDLYTLGHITIQK